MVWGHWDDSKPIITQIKKALFLGNAAAASDETALKTHGIKRILSITDNSCHRPDKRFCESLGIEQKIFPVDDLWFGALHRQDVSNEILPWIKESVEQDKNLLVQCAASRSRSPSCIITFLIWHDGMEFASALNRLYEIHPLTNPMPGTIESFLESINRVLPEWYEKQWEERRRTP